MTFGLSRDDVNTFLPDYLRQEILSRDPFQSLGVGQLVQLALNKGRSIKPQLK
jgi:pyruvate,orthophosphate dikinase